MGKKRSQAGSKPANAGKQFLGKKNFKSKDNKKSKVAQAAKQFGNQKGGPKPTATFPKFGGGAFKAKGDQKKHGQKTSNQKPQGGIQKFGGGSPKGKPGSQSLNKQAPRSVPQFGKKRPLPVEKGKKTNFQVDQKPNFKQNGSPKNFQGGVMKNKNTVKPIPKGKGSFNKQGAKSTPKTLKKQPGVLFTKQNDEDEDDEDDDDDDEMESDSDEAESDEEGDTLQMLEEFGDSDDEDLSDFDLDESEEDEDEDEDSDEDTPGRIVQIDELESDDENDDDQDAPPLKKTKLAIEAKPKETKKEAKKPQMEVKKPQVDTKKSQVEAKKEKDGGNKVKVTTPTTTLEFARKERSLKSGDLTKLAEEVKSRMEKIRQRSIHIHPIPRTCNAGMLKEVAREMVGCRIPIKLQNRETRGYAFLEFRTPAIALKYRQLLDGKMLNGKQMKTSEVKGDLFIFSGIENYDLKRLYVSGLARETTKSDVKNVFSKCESVDMLLTKDNSSVGFCTVSFASEEDALEAFDLGHGTVVKGHALCVNFLNKNRSKQKDALEQQRQKKDANITKELNIIKKEQMIKKEQQQEAKKKKGEAAAKPESFDATALSQAIKALRSESEKKQKELKGTRAKKEEESEEEASDEEEEMEVETPKTINKKQEEKMKKAHEAILKMLENEEFDDDDDDEEEEEEDDDDVEEEEDDDDDDEDEDDDDDNEGEEDDDDDEDEDDDEEEEEENVQKIQINKAKAKKFRKK